VIVGALVLQRHVRHRRSAEEGRRIGRHHLVVLGLDHGVVDPGHRVAPGIQLLEEGRTLQLLGAGQALGQGEGGGQPHGGDGVQQGAHAVDGGPVVGGGQSHQVVDVFGSTVEAQVPARHHAPLRPADEVDLAGAGGSEHLPHEAGQLAN
jgi:hypothetical protein